MTPILNDVAWFCFVAIAYFWAVGMYAVAMMEITIEREDDDNGQEEADQEG